jgi:NAD(P)H-dependent FMN reductase
MTQFPSTATAGASSAPRVRILAFAGSLRHGSYNKKLIAIAAQGARETGAEVTLIDLRDFPLPIFDEDLERAEGLPAKARDLKDLFLGHQGLLLSCPEYNSSITAVLKNTIDWVSRPVPNEKPLACFVGKVAGLLAASPGGYGGLRGLVTVRSILSNIHVLVLPDQLAVARAHEAFDELGQLKDAPQLAAALSLGRRVAETTAKLLR